MARKSGLQDSREAVVKIYTVTKELNDEKQKQWQLELVLEVAFLVVSTSNLVIMRFLSNHW